jgi:ABC-type Fe3+/spermidine/putrescine transport system ATPase subunit
MADAILKLKGISKTFSGTKAVNNLSLEVRQNEVCSLLGPSGCGKTTTLRLVGGLEKPDEGEIEYQGKVIVSASTKIFVPPHRRNMGMVFQSYAIWPNMTVWENVAYPLKLRRAPSKTIDENVARVLGLVGLTGLETRPAPLLSGGQQQRVALARSLIYEPGLLLLDEPFSNLDAKLREQMRVELKILQKKVGITVLFVTHDQIEALSLSDRIVVMNQGHVEQVGTPQELYDQPETPFVRDFLGRTLLVRGNIADVNSRGEAAVSLERVPEAVLWGQPHPFPELRQGQQVHVAIRPEAIVIEAGDLQPMTCAEKNLLKGNIEALLFVGDRFECRIQVADERLFFYLPRTGSWHEGQKVSLTFPREAVSLWPS